MPMSIRPSQRRRRRFLRERPHQHLALLDPAQYTSILAEDYDWTVANAPIIDFDDDAEATTIAQAYFYRWRVFRRHLRRRQSAAATLCCSGRASTCTLVSAEIGWCAGAKARSSCHDLRTEGRPCVWSSGRCTKGFAHGSAQSPVCPALSSAADEWAVAASSGGSGSVNEWVVTEFETDVSWAGHDNTIACSAGHHLMEGRWLRNASYLDSYSRFWFEAGGGGGTPRAYTFWAATAVYERYKVSGDITLLRSLYPALAANYDAWVASHWAADGACFWQYADRDGQEHSIGGDGCRPLLNSVMFAEAAALGAIAALLADETGRQRFALDAERSRRAVLSLWHDERRFFVTRATARPPGVPRARWAEKQQQKARELSSHGQCPPRWREGELVTSRELAGLTSPWYFGVPPRETAARYLVSWARLFDDVDGFAARWGPRTAERSDPCHDHATGHECNWNGPSWPFETSKAIGAGIRVLREYAEAAEASGALDASRLWGLLKQYAHAHTHGRATNASAWELPGAGRAWIGEAMHPDEGYWLVRHLLYAKADPSRNRGARYHHSTYCDLVLQFLGLRPLGNGTLLVQPLLPASSRVRYFALDGVRLRGRDVCVAYDHAGSRYGLGAGLHVLLEGVVVASGALGEVLRVEL